ncbi:MAG: rod shape-determining protein [Lachnospiraceae bacterium]|nr:rod shape-determining protein [Lachnospiraceae bacterium]
MRTGLFKKNTKCFGIDFGTDTIKIYKKGTGLVYVQKTAIAVKNKKTVIAIGDEAYDMYGKVPEQIEVIFPLINGVIASFDRMVSFMNCVFLDLTREIGKFYGAEFHLVVPADLSELEKKAFYDVIDKSFIRASRVLLYDKPAVDAIGCGIDFNRTEGTLICDIGAETTEVSAIAGGTILHSRLFKNGGKDIDDAISAGVKKNYNLIIGKKTAENCKKNVLTLLEDDDRTEKVYGIDLVDNMPKELLLTDSLARPYADEFLNSLIDNIKSVIERIPPEFASDFYKCGITITGGTSSIKGLEKYLKDNLKFEIKTAEDPSDTAINGLALIMEGKYKLEQEV